MSELPTPQAQRYKGVVVSKPGCNTKRAKRTVAISTAVTNYVQLDEEQLRWLVEEAGPKALEALRDVA